MKRKTNKWEDHYSRRARKENYPARSVYKLEEIQNKYKIIKKGDRILDLGCAPGSWLIYASGIIGSSGRITGIDKKELNIKLPENADFFCADIFSADEKLIDKKYNTILSDMAPDTTGRKDTDATRSYELCMQAFNLAKKFLEPKGTFVCKIFFGENFKLFSDQVKALFNESKIFKPKTCRKASKEIYIIGKDKKICRDIANGQT